MILLYELFAFERARLNRVVFFGFSNVTGNVAFLRHGGDKSFAFLRCWNERKKKKEKLIVVRITRTYERTIFSVNQRNNRTKGKDRDGRKTQCVLWIRQAKIPEKNLREAWNLLQRRSQISLPFTTDLSAGKLLF